MGNVKIRYYSVIKGRGYWRPTRKMRRVGFEIVRCGPDGPEAWAMAERWNARWDKVRTGTEPSPSDVTTLSPKDAEALVVYPPGSIGDAFKRYRGTDAWKGKAQSTRDDWFAGWFHIRSLFGDADPNTIDFEMIDKWYSDLRRDQGHHTAWRAMKYWRALWQVMGAMKLCDPGQDPSKARTNAAPAGRSATWSEGEAVRLVKHAWRSGYIGLAAAVATIWDTQFSPVDARLLTPRQRLTDASGRTFFDTARGKTSKPAIGTLSRRSEALLDAYLQRLGVELTEGAQIFRNRSGRPYTKDKLGQDFRVIREDVFPGDTRRLMDMRRSGAVEAQAGEVKAETLSAKMANSIAQSSKLQRTYLPGRVATVRLADEARRIGRRRLRENEE